MYIDPHVHLRDFNQREKETVRHGLEVARDCGLSAVFDMPNTDPPIMTRNLARERLKIARNANVPEVFYGLYLGLTANPEQVQRAVECFREHDEIIGMKLYAGHSVGNLGVIGEDQQRTVYQTLSQEEYSGLLAVHCEKESYLHHDHWDPNHPISHCHARPEASEVASVTDQLRLAQETGYAGKIHIAHISSPRAVELVNEARARGQDVSSGICPHHFLYDWSAMYNEHGIRMKMNPPLRSPESRAQMFDYLREGKIDLIETDHAPHTLADKIKPPYQSGIPGLPWWPLFEEYLRAQDFTDQQIEALTFTNAVQRFGLDITKRREITLRDRRPDYPFDPYEPIAHELGWHPQ